MNESEVILRVFVILFFGFILLTVILPFTPEGYRPILLQIISAATFLLGCYILKEVLRLKRGIKMEIFAEKIIDKAVNLWILIAITYFLFFASIFFLLFQTLITPTYIISTIWEK